MRAAAQISRHHHGLADAVLTNFGTDHAAGAGSTITVLYGKAGGGFNRVALNTNGKNVSFVSVADINGDGWQDVVAVNANQQNTGSVSVFRNDGAGNLTLVTFARTSGNIDGQVMAFFVMAVAAAEVVVGLAIIMAIYRSRRSASVDDANLLKA